MHSSHLIKFVQWSNSILTNPDKRSDAFLVHTRPSLSLTLLHS